MPEENEPTPTPAETEEETPEEPKEEETPKEAKEETFCEKVKRLKAEGQETRHIAWMLGVETPDVEKCL